MFNTGKVAVAADTNVQIAGEDFTEVNTAWRTSKVKLQFTADTPPAVLQVAKDSATLTADEGFVIFVDSELGVTQELDLVAGEGLWVRSDGAGDIRYLVY